MENNDFRDREEIFSKVLRAGRRTYFLERSADFPIGATYSKSGEISTKYAEKDQFRRNFKYFFWRYSTWQFSQSSYCTFTADTYQSDQVESQRLRIMQSNPHQHFW